MSNNTIQVNLQFRADTNSAKREMRGLQEQLTKISQDGFNIKSTGFNKEISKASQTAMKLKIALNEATNMQTGVLNLNQFTVAMNKAGLNAKTLAADLSKLGPEGAKAFEQVTMAVTKASTSAFSLGAGLNKFFNTLFSNMRYQAANFAIQGVTSAFRDTINYAKALDKSLTNIQFVTGKSEKEMAKFAVTANKAAKSLSIATQTYTDASLIYFQQGLNEKEVAKRTDITVKLAAVTRQSAEQVSEWMTAIWNNYNDGSQSLEHYADVLAKLGAATASSVDEIAAGLSKFSAVAEVVGLSYERASALIATVASQTRESAETIGTAFKTIFSRMEGLSLGETLDDGTTLNKYSAALASVGVNIKTTSGALKDMDTILDETAETWKLMSRDQQVALAQTVAGVRQYNQFIAMMDTWDTMEKNEELAKNSADAVNKMYKDYEDSVEGHTERMKANLEDVKAALWGATNQKDFMKGMANMTESLGHFIRSLGGLPGILLKVGSLLTKLYKPQISKFFSSMALSVRDFGSKTANAFSGKGYISNRQIKEKNSYVNAYAEMNKSEQGGQTETDLLKREAELQQKFLQQQNQMTEAQKQEYQWRLDSLKVMRQQVVELSKAASIANDERTQSDENFQSALENATPTSTKTQVKNTASWVSEQVSNKPSNVSLKTKEDKINYGEQIAVEVEHVRNLALQAGQDITNIPFDSTLEVIRAYGQEAGITFKELQQIVKDTMDLVANGGNDFQSAGNTALAMVSDKPEDRPEGMQMPLQSTENKNSYKEQVAQQLAQTRDLAMQAGKDVTNIPFDSVLATIQTYGEQAGITFQDLQQIVKETVSEIENAPEIAFNKEQVSEANINDTAESTASLKHSSSKLATKAKTASGFTGLGKADKQAIGMEIDADFSDIIAQTQALGIEIESIDGFEELQQQIQEMANTGAGEIDGLAQKLDEFNQKIQQAASQKLEKTADTEALSGFATSNQSGQLKGAKAKKSGAQKEIKEQQKKLKTLQQYQKVLAKTNKEENKSEKGKKKLTKEEKKLLKEIKKLGKSEADLQEEIEDLNKEIEKNKKIISQADAEIDEITSDIKKNVTANQQLEGSYEEVSNSANELAQNTEKAAQKQKEFKEGADGANDAMDDLSKSMGEKTSKVSDMFTSGISGVTSLTSGIVGLSSAFSELGKKVAEGDMSWQDWLGTIGSVGMSLLELATPIIQITGLIMSKIAARKLAKKASQEEANQEQIDAGKKVAANTVEAGSNIAADAAKGPPGWAIAAISLGAVAALGIGIAAVSFSGGQEEAEQEKDEEARQERIEQAREEAEAYGEAAETFDKFGESIDKFKELQASGESTVEVFNEITKTVEELQEKINELSAKGIKLDVNTAELIAATAYAQATGDITWLESLTKKGSEQVKKAEAMNYRDAYEASGEAEDRANWIESEMAYMESNGEMEDIHTKLLERVEKAGGLDKVPTSTLRYWYQELLTQHLQKRYGSDVKLSTLEMEMFLGATSGDVSTLFFDQSRYGLGGTTWTSSKHGGEEYLDYFNKDTGTLNDPDSIFTGDVLTQDYSTGNIKGKYAHQKFKLNDTEASKKFYHYNLVMGETGQATMVQYALEGRPVTDYLSDYLHIPIEEQDQDKYSWIKQLYQNVLTHVKKQREESGIEKLTGEAYDWYQNLDAESKVLVSGPDFSPYAPAGSNMTDEEWRNKQLADKKAEAAHQNAVIFFEDNELGGETGLNYFVKKLQESHEGLKGNQEAAEKAAVSIQRLNKGFNSLLSDWEDIEKKIASDDMETRLEGLTAIQESLETAFGVEIKDLSVIEDNLPLIQRIMAGEYELIGELAKKLAQDYIEDIEITVEMGIEDPEKFKQEAKDLVNDLDLDIPIGTSVDISSIATLDTATRTWLTNIVKNGGPALDILNQMVGFEGLTIGMKDGKVVVTRLNDGNFTLNPDNMPEGGDDKEEKKYEDEIERYHKIEKAIADVNRELELLNTAKDRAFGPSKLALMDEEIAKQKELLALEEQYRAEIEENLKNDKGIMIHYGAEFDEYGNIINYDELMKEYIDKYNAGEISDEEYEIFTDSLSQYEETSDLYKDKMKEIIDYKNEIFDAELEKASYTVEFNIEVNDDQLALLEHQLEFLDDSIEDTATSLALLGKQTEINLSKVETYRQGIRDTLGVSGFTEAEIEALLGGDMSVLEGKELTADQLSQLNEYKDSLLELNNTFLETYNTIEEKLITAFEHMNEEMDTEIAKIDHLNSMAQGYKDIIDLVGKDNLGISDKIMKDLDNSLVKTNQNALQATKAKLDADKSALAEAEQALAEARERNATEDIEMWENVVKTLSETVTEGEEELMSRWQTALESAADAFANAVEMVVQTFEEAMSGLAGSFDALQEKYDQQGEINERYLADYTKIYELSRLNRDLTKSIDDTDNIAAKSKLRDLQEEINTLQNSNNKMTQYEVDVLRAKYDLRLAEIALEEAQNAKSQVRMQRDSEGNWGYVYTANQDATAKAEQNYEDKLYAMQQLMQDSAKNMQDMLMALPQEFAEAIRAINEDTTLSEEERNKKINETSTYYGEKQNYILSQLEKVSRDSSELYKQDWQNFANATGYKISANEDWVDSFDESVYAQVTGFETLEQVQNVFNQSTKKMLSDLVYEYDQWQLEIDKANKLAGVSTQDFATIVSDETQRITKDSQDTAEAVIALAEAGEEGFGGLVDMASSYLIEYSSLMDDYINKNYEVAESINAIKTSYEGAVQAQSDWSTSAGAIAPPTPSGGSGNLGDLDLGGTQTVTIRHDTHHKSYEGEMYVDVFGEDKSSGYYYKLSDLGTGEKVTGGTQYTVSNITKIYTAKDFTDPPFEPGDQVKITNTNGKNKITTYQLGSDGSIDGKGAGYKQFDPKKVYTVSNGVGKNRTNTGDFAYYQIDGLGIVNWSFLKPASLDTGGYTGSWDSSGRLAMLHQKEIVLNAHDTENFLSAIDILRDITKAIDLQAISQSMNLQTLSSITANPSSQTIEQKVEIHAEFPYATNRGEIEAAFDTLINRASQFANRKN